MVKPKLIVRHSFPNTYREFIKMFPDNAACATYLAQIRWPDRFVCPACQKISTPWNESRGRLECPLCHHQTSVTAGTIFDKTRTPLTTWFEAAWHITTAQNGVSAKALTRALGTSYRVAWMMLQRFRIAMARRERKQLSGDIEIDEILVNGIRPNGKRGQGAAKSIVIVALEIKPPKGLGRMRMRHIPDTSDYSLLPFVHDAISPGSVILTDGWHGYDKLSGLGFIHKITKLSDSGDHAHISMPNIHRISGLLTKSFLGTFQGIVLEHLQSYLEEFTFRYNARRLQSRGLVFRRLLEQAIVTEPVTEIDVAHGYDWN